MSVDARVRQPDSKLPMSVLDLDSLTWLPSKTYGTYDWACQMKPRIGAMVTCHKDAIIYMGGMHYQVSVCFSN